MVYAASDAERFVGELHTSSRSPYARDRARIIHSSGLRRLAAKTQVLSPTSLVDFARNRLTHSLEVAQIGSEIATALGLEKDIVDAACLAHDLGHPPFGHNGEKALDTWNFNFGGFEGNAQTLRILTRLEPKKFDADGKSVGLNLTRATLDASIKYPWSRQEAIGTLESQPMNSPKFGYFEDDAEIFDWARKGADPGKKSAEAQVMDLADDIAYSVHDFEDAVLNGSIDPEILNSKHGHAILLEKIVEWSGAEFTTDQIALAFERISKMESGVLKWGGSFADEAKLKNFTSDMIGRFARGAIEMTLQSADTKNIARYGSDILVPQSIKEEIAVLKGLVAAFVMESGQRMPTYSRQRELLSELLETLWQGSPKNLDPSFRDLFEHADTEAAARRVIVDQVASLTDQSAIAWYNRLCSVPLV